MACAARHPCPTTPPPTRPTRSGPSPACPLPSPVRGLPVDNRRPRQDIPCKTRTMTEIILDVDTGVDDALAILFAVRHPDLRLRAITCVAGNADVDQVVANTLRVLDAAGAPDVPVARGADRPLLEPRRDARHVHGTDGMGDLGLPASARQPVAVHAVELLRREILAAPTPVTLITLAPLTNIALLL